MKQLECKYFVPGHASFTIIMNGLKEAHAETTKQMHPKQPTFSNVVSKFVGHVGLHPELKDLQAMCRDIQYLLEQERLPYIPDDKISKLQLQ